MSKDSRLDHSMDHVTVTGDRRLLICSAVMWKPCIGCGLVQGFEGGSSTLMIDVLDSRRTWTALGRT